MSFPFVVGADAVIEQLVIQCWRFEVREGRGDWARRQAELALERLLRAGLPHENGADGLRLDPYAAANRIKCRRGELEDESWSAWLRTARRHARSLPAHQGRYTLVLRREWHDYAISPGRPLILRLPLPLRGTQRGPAALRLVEGAEALLDQREGAGRVELRLDAARVRGPVVAEMRVAFDAGDVVDEGAPADPLGAPADPEDEPWLRAGDGLLPVDAPLRAQAAALAAALPPERRDARGFVHAAWNWLIATLRFGDWHGSEREREDPFGWLLRSRRADCILGSSLLIALCRAQGIPARLLTGFLLHPANPGPHSWAEVRLARDRWVPFDFGAWCYSAGDPQDPEWGAFYRGRVDPRFLAEVAPREFTGWGSAKPPERWYRLEALDGDRLVHTLHSLPENRLFRRDTLELLGGGPA